MAKNITLMGASYSNVPAVQLPQTGGGTARFDDVSVTTATASDVASGKVFLAADGTITTGTASGGGGAFTITATFSNGQWATLDKTFAQIQSAYGQGETIVVSAYDTYGDMPCPTYCDYYSDAQTFMYYVSWFDFQDTGHQYVDTYLMDVNGVTLDDRQEYGHPTTLVEKTITANGTYNPILTDSADGYSLVKVNVSGGASNFVTGTFTTGSSVSTNETVDVPYGGSGYPIMLVVYVEGGCYNSAISGWYNSVVRYAVGQFCITKGVTTTTPSYRTSGGENYGTVQLLFKNSTSSATSYSSTRGASANSYSSSNATGTSTTCVRWRSNTRISYRTAGGTSSTYGLLEDTTYRYVVLYSE